MDGNDWAYDDSVRLADFRTLDALIFGGYGTIGGASFEAEIDDSSPVQVRLYFPIWIQGAVPRARWLHAVGTRTTAARR